MTYKPKNYLRANFHALAYNFYGHIRQFFRSYKIVSPKNAKRGKACALPLSAVANVWFFFGFAKSLPVVPGAVKACGGAFYPPLNQGL